MSGSRTIQIDLTLNLELSCHFAPFDKETGTPAGWVLDEIVSMNAEERRGVTYDLATSSILANYLITERGEELADLYAQQEP